MTQTTRRQRQDASAWREILSRYAQSGLTVEAFCRGERIGVWSLYRWRSRLGATARRGPPRPSTIAGQQLEPEEGGVWT